MKRSSITKQIISQRKQTFISLLFQGVVLILSIQHICAPPCPLSCILSSLPSLRGAVLSHMLFFLNKVIADTICPPQRNYVSLLLLILLLRSENLLRLHWGAVGSGGGKSLSYDFPINQMFSLTLTSLKYFLLREGGKKRIRTSFECQFLFSQHTTSTHPQSRVCRAHACGYLCVCSSSEKPHMECKSSLALQSTMSFHFPKFCVNCR